MTAVHHEEPLNAVHAASHVAPATTMVVVHYRDPYAVEALLRAITGWTSRPERVVVVDNSGDLQLTAHEEYVEVSDPGRNAGYGPAVNHAWDEVLGRPRDGLLLVCTQDAHLDSDAFEELLRAMHADPHAGIVAPTLLYRDTPDRVFSLGGTLSRSAVPHHIGSDSATADRPRTGTATIDWADGAVLLIRNEVMDALKGFAPEYFLYVEEIDFAFRARLAGWATTIAYAARASQQPGNYRTYLRYRNSIHFSRKHREYLRTWPWPQFLAEDVARLVLRRHRFSITQAVLGIAHAYLGRMGPIH